MLLLAMLAGAVLPGCEAPFGIGQPTTRVLESGAAESLAAATSFEIRGSYSDESSAVWIVDLQVTRPDAARVLVSRSGAKLEALVLGGEAYYRGSEFLSQHMGSDPLSRSLVRAAGNAWWKGPSGYERPLPDLTDGSRFEATFLGPAVTRRSDHVSVAGIEAVELSGPRADVYVSTRPPHRPLRVLLKTGVTVDGIRLADLRYGAFGQDFRIVPPTDVIDFSNLSTLPPVYSVLSVNAQGCGSPCVVSALLKNLGGMSGARTPSTVTFTMIGLASNREIGSCRAPVVPDVGYNGTTTVACTIDGVAREPLSVANVVATADNPGRD